MVYLHDILVFSETTEDHGRYLIDTERPFIPGLYLIIVNNDKRIIILYNSVNSIHPTVLAQAKPQPKDQM